MNNLIRADLGRILKKISFYILPAAAIAILALWPDADNAADQVEGLRHYINYAALLLICIAVYLNVYSDELKSGRMISVIGSGLSRRRIILAKLADSALIFTLFFAVVYALVFLKNRAAGIGVTPRQNLLLLICCVYTVIKGIGFVAFSSLAVYTAWNTSAGMVFLVLGIPLSRLFLSALQEQLSLPLYDLSFEGLLESSYTGIAAGNSGWQIIPAVGIYLCGVIALSVYLFNRKEISL